jgi:hypothetical protein
MTITPQTLGSLIKRTGIMKSENRKGRMYDYHTEGYTLERQYDGRYRFTYIGRLELVIRNEAQEQRLAERRREALSTVLSLLSSKGITTELSGTDIYITLEASK